MPMHVNRPAIFRREQTFGPLHSAMESMIDRLQSVDQFESTMIETKGWGSSFTLLVGQQELHPTISPYKWRITACKSTDAVILSA